MFAMRMFGKGYSKSWKRNDHFGDTDMYYF